MKITARDFDRRIDRHFDLKLSRRNAGGWVVSRRDTGHRLGWLYLDVDGLWQARTGGDPFVPHGLDILDKLRAEDAVDDYLTGRTGPAAYRAVAADRKRTEAAVKLVEYLLRARALAVQPVDVAATQAGLADHEAQAASYREAAESPHMAEAGRPMMRRAAEVHDADAAALRAQLAAGVSA